MGRLETISDYDRAINGYQVPVEGLSEAARFESLKNLHAGRAVVWKALAAAALGDARVPVELAWAAGLCADADVRESLGWERHAAKVAKTRTKVKVKAAERALRR